MGHSPFKLALGRIKGQNPIPLEQLHGLGTTEGWPMKGDLLHILNHRFVAFETILQRKAMKYLVLTELVYCVSLPTEGSSVRKRC